MFLFLSGTAEGTKRGVGHDCTGRPQRNLTGGQGWGRLQRPPVGGVGGVRVFLRLSPSGCCIFFFDTISNESPRVCLSVQIPFISQICRLCSCQIILKSDQANILSRARGFRNHTRHVLYYDTINNELTYSPLGWLIGSL